MAGVDYSLLAQPLAEANLRPRFGLLEETPAALEPVSRNHSVNWVPQYRQVKTVAEPRASIGFPCGFSGAQARALDHKKRLFPVKKVIEELLSHPFPTRAAHVHVVGAARPRAIRRDRSALPFAPPRDDA